MWTSTQYPQKISGFYTWGHLMTPPLSHNKPWPSQQSSLCPISQERHDLAQQSESPVASVTLWWTSSVCPLMDHAHSHPLQIWTADTVLCIQYGTLPQQRVVMEGVGCKCEFMPLISKTALLSTCPLLKKHQCLPETEHWLLWIQSIWLITHTFSFFFFPNLCLEDSLQRDGHLPCSVFPIRGPCTTRDDNCLTVTRCAPVFVTCGAVSASLRVDICKTSALPIFSTLCDDPRETEWGGKKERNPPHHLLHPTVCWRLKAP